MERITVKGLNVRETETGDYDKIITLVTAEYGKLSVTAKGVKSLKNKNMAVCQPFCYSTYTLKKSKKFWYVEEAELIESFYGLRGDLDKFSLAAYFCDVLCDVSIENAPDVEMLRLTLNTLYATANREREELSKIKAAFEMRAAALLGFLPELSGCDVCGCEPARDVYLDIMNGRLLCPDCKPRAEKEEAMIEGTARLYFIITPAVLLAMRYIISCPQEKLLGFTLSEDDMYILSKACEAYLLNHLEHSFSTLEFYKSVLI